MKRRRTRNLQPWLDYFTMLQSYERSGLLQVEPEKHEAYVTEAALMSLSPGGGEPDASIRRDYLAAGIPAAVRRLRAYAGWLSREGAGYVARPFAVHVVGDAAPHDLLYTLLMSRRRRWWRLWTASDTVETVAYGERGKP